MFKVSTDKLISICRQLTSYCIYLVLFLVPIVFAWQQGNFNIFELNKLLVFKVLLFLACLFTATSIIIKGTWRPIIDRRLLLIISSLVVYALVNIFLSLNPWQSFFGDYMRQQGIYSLFYYWLWFIVLLHHWRSSLNVKSVLLVTVLASIPVVVYGFVQKLGFDWLLWSEPGTGRTFASLGQPNFLGYYLVLVIFLSLAYSKLLVKLWHKLLAWLLLVLQLTVLIFTGSRGAFFGLLAGLALLVMLRFWRATSRLRIISLTTLAIILALGSYLLVNNLIDRGLITNPTIVHYSSAFSSVQGSSKARLFYWQAAWQDFQSTSWSRRLLGYGKDTQRSVFVKYYQPEWGLHERLNSYPDRAHNLIIDLWLDFGLIGLLLFAIFNLYIISRAFIFWCQSRSDQLGSLIPYLLAAVCAYFVSNLFGFSLTTHYIYYYLLLALLYLLSSTSKSSEALLPFSKTFAYLSFSAILIFNLFCLWQFDYKYLIADRYFMQAKVAEANMDCAGTIEAINLTSDWQPLNQYYQEKSLFMYSNCLPLVDEPTRQAMMSSLLHQIQSIGQDHSNYDLTLNLARVYSLLGFYFDKVYYASAELEYQRLLTINPSILSAYQDYGRMLIWSGEYQQAENILRRGIALSPMQLSDYSSGGYHELTASHTYGLWKLIADCAYNQKRFKEALDIYQDIEQHNLISLELYKNIADSYYQIKQYHQVESYLLKGFALAPDDLNNNLAIARFYLSQKNLAEARKFAQLVLQSSPLQPEALKIIDL
jgi:O-antigen ligase/Tfp pilus assembly protein PilF